MSQMDGRIEADEVLFEVASDNGQRAILALANTSVSIVMRPACLTPCWIWAEMKVSVNRVKRRIGKIPTDTKRSNPSVDPVRNVKVGATKKIPKTPRHMTRMSCAICGRYWSRR